MVTNSLRSIGLRDDDGGGDDNVDPLLLANYMNRMNELNYIIIKQFIYICWYDGTRPFDHNRKKKMNNHHTSRVLSFDDNNCRP